MLGLLIVLCLSKGQLAFKGVPLSPQALCSEVSSEGSLRSCDRFTVFNGLHGLKETPLKTHLRTGDFFRQLGNAFLPGLVGLRARTHKQTNSCH